MSENENKDDLIHTDHNDIPNDNTNKEKDEYEDIC